MQNDELDRKGEIRRLLQLTPDEVQSGAGDRLWVCESLDDLHRVFAGDVAEEIRIAAYEDRLCRLILPVGPTGGYPYLLQAILEGELDLSHCRFFFMDEYCDEDGSAVTADHPLSFKGEMEHLFFSNLPPACGLDRSQVVFPDEQNIGSLAEHIDDMGGIDVCFGGVGIHGHIAFNEPEPGVADSGPRRVELNDFTLTINAVRAGVGGNLECFPRYAYTLGLRQILGARRIRLYIRNGCEFDWANTVLRLALLGTPGEDYPVTLIRDRDFTVITDRDTLQSPTRVL